MVLPPTAHGPIPEERISLGMEGSTPKARFSCPTGTVGKGSGASLEISRLGSHLRGATSTLSGVKDFCHSETSYRMETNSGRIGPKSALGSTVIQDDEPQITGIPSPASSSMGSFIGFEGCLYACTDTAKLAQIPGVNLLEETFLLQEPAVRASPGPMVVLSPNGAGPEPTQEARNSGPRLHRRLDFLAPGQGHVVSPGSQGNGIPGSIGLDNKCGEVTSFAHIIAHLARSGVARRSRDVVSSTKAIAGHSERSASVNYRPKVFKTFVGEPARLNSFCGANKRKSGALGTQPGSPQLFRPQNTQRRAGSTTSEAERSATSLGKDREVDRARSFRATTSRSPVLDRRLDSGLGHSRRKRRAIPGNLVRGRGKACRPSVSRRQPRVPARSGQHI